MYKRKSLCYLLVALISATFLTACGTNNTANSETKEIPSVTAKASNTSVSKDKSECLETVSKAYISLESLVKTPEVKSESPDPTIEPQPPAETEELIIQEPQITELNATMYATRDINVRTGDNKDTSLIGSLTTGQEVLVTGQSSSSGWYRIDYNGQAGFVSNKYLQSEMPTSQSVPENKESEMSQEQPVQSQPEVKEKSGSVQSILNSAALNPSKSGFGPLDTLLDNLFAQILTSDMNTYQKVKTCYDYLIQNCSYGMNERMFDYIEYLFGGYGNEVSAYGMLTGHVGVCDDYSAAFAAMTKAIGLDCRVVSGQTHKTDGGYTPHAWCVINIDGTEYVFDPQVEDNIAKGGAIQYYRFCKRYDEVPDKYIVE